MDNISSLDIGEKIGFWLCIIYALSANISPLASTFSVYGSALLIIYKLIKDDRARLRLPPSITKAILAFFAVFAFTSVFSTAPLQSYNQLLQLATRFVPFFMPVLFLRTRKDLITVAVLLEISIIIADIYSIWQKFHGICFPTGFDHNHIFFANQLQPMILMGLVLLNDKKISWRLKYFFSFAAFFSIAVLLLNGCRGVWLSIIICMLTIGFLLRKRHPRILAMLLILILLSAMALWFVPFLHARLITITDTHFEPNTERVLMLKSAWRMFLDHPLVGVGLDRWQYYYRHQYVSPLAHEPGVDSPHNNFAMYLDETGIIGLSAFIGLFAAVLLSLYKDFKSRSDWFALIAFSVVLGFLLGGLTDHTFRMMNVIRLMWFCVGLGSVTLDTRT